ncbi:hypothetical protein HMPREF0454_04983 [Hafnia alvei ATCC 51873]|uniref:Uncharacterized protein n=1 Tax=Hafnia alvei ATCC 51873 TaxID=1002364 RepID=G9YED4_HAFAL|nr:hypothetical protein HMPREF0454_04983 [Hafnia alvei ATCC 51873]
MPVIWQPKIKSVGSFLFHFSPLFVFQTFKQWSGEGVWQSVYGQGY